ncbi:PAS domain-containing sensor histidine kinase [Azospirillum picis]|uniref:histidine kinase n=1 Tax=Azospirillum picis TaxID=488438 RepID=A0ABU0MLW7_9PROT|nr:PAS domain-containing sensor histidine kinase [Azospirillum picis]MBP2300494.1 PAS domain S-box-containing protein [Azospirillum picis]MDQ0534463.1 PAS domain S-box-containing protein [Azospirillum picis]
MAAEPVMVALAGISIGGALGVLLALWAGRRARRPGSRAPTSCPETSPPGSSRPDSSRCEPQIGERLEMALEATGAAVWDADLLAGACWWSDTFPRMLGFREPPTMPPDFWERRLHPDDRDRVLAHIASHLAGETSSYAYAYRLRHEDGGWVWIAATGRAFRDETGRAVRYAGIMTDITEARRQEARLRASEERLLKIMEAAPIAVNVTTRDGRWLFCNAQSAILMGRGRAELMRTPVTDLYADPADRRALIARFDREGAFRNAEIRFRRPDGGIVWVLSSWNTVELDGEAALLTWLYDITDRKHAESAMVEAREAAERALADLREAQESLIQAETMASLGQLVAGVAHEINTPIGIGLTAASHIGEQAQVLRERFVANALRRSEFLEFLDGLNESSRLLMANIDRAASLVQSFKQVAVDQSSGDRRLFELGGYVHELLFSLRPRLKRSGLKVVVECGEELTMDSFPGALGQVMTNLVINALVHAYGDGDRAGEAQPGTIRIAARADGADRVRIDFIDDGAGIAPETLPKVFDPFFTTKRGQGGSGLGLHIVFNTVTGPLGGTIAVQSRLGQGTRFILHLPREAPALQPVPAQEAALT